MENDFMAGNKLTIKLTDEQQSQIKSATGRSTTELHIDVGAMKELNAEDLEEVSGGINFPDIQGKFS